MSVQIAQQNNCSENVMNGRKKSAAHGQYCCQQLTAKTAGESIQTKVSSPFQRTSSGNISYAHVVILSFYIGIFAYQQSRPGGRRVG